MKLNEIRQKMSKDLKSIVKSMPKGTPYYIIDPRGGRLSKDPLTIDGPYDLNIIKKKFDALPDDIKQVYQIATWDGTKYMPVE